MLGEVNGEYFLAMEYLDGQPLRRKAVPVQAPRALPEVEFRFEAAGGAAVAVQRLRGAADHPFTRGTLCPKVNRFLDRVHSPDRILHPLRRTGPKGSGQFTRISWDEALDEMADGLVRVREKYGPLAIAGAVSGAFFSRGLVMAQLTRAMGTPNWRRSFT